MQKLRSYIQRNKLTTALILLVGFMIWRNTQGNPLTPIITTEMYESGSDMSYTLPQSGGAPEMDSAGMARSDMSAKIAPVPPYESGISISQDRMVTTESFMSVVVQDVRDMSSTIKRETEMQGGFMISNDIQSGDASTPSGSISVRIPSNNLNGFLEFLREKSVKVVSENLLGTDITEQFEDVEKQLATLEKTKAKFEEILDRATTVDETLQVQREIINLQSQIDSYKGRKDFYEKSASLSKLTVYMSTDELELPYAPKDRWRPEVIFKEAVRSLLETFQNVGSYIIWIIVYSVIIIPAFLILRWASRRMSRNSSNSTRAN